MAVFPLATPIFEPAIRQIAALTPIYSFNELILIVTTTQDHLYKNGLVVRLDIPLENQAQQVNNLLSEIVIISPTQFSMILPPIQFDPFIIPSVSLQAPQTIPIAENVLLLNSAVTNVLFNPQL